MSNTRTTTVIRRDKDGKFFAGFVAKGISRKPKFTSKVKSAFHYSRPNDGNIDSMCDMLAMWSPSGRESHSPVRVEVDADADLMGIHF